IMLKLEFVKKPLYLILLIIGINIDVYVVAWTMVIYNVVAVFINMAPNRKLLGYNIKEQLSDMIPALLNSSIMYLVVDFLGNTLSTPLILTLVIQIFVGVAIYVGIALIFKMEGFKNVLEVLKEVLKKD
ncbi:polysaccharide biosynthesis C-terminal domain-containing protein, partial [Lactobacillus delbrueckii subsp. bulgaricus]|nr:lipopolysaccharide biosynthesis protein [Lactobacillus delbrueckii subsp. bulgaricus]